MQLSFKREIESCGYYNLPYLMAKFERPNTHLTLCNRRKTISFGKKMVSFKDFKQFLNDKEKSFCQIENDDGTYSIFKK